MVLRREDLSILVEMKELMRRVIGVVIVLTCVAMIPFASRAQNIAPPGAGTIDKSRLVELSGNVHPLARAEFDRGAVADSLPLEHLMLQLKRHPAQQKALDALIAGLYDPHSPNYHQWLTAQQYGDSFGPSKDEVATLTRWLEAHGFTVNVVYPSGTAIDISGTAAAVRKAFHTTIHTYEVGGVGHIANASEPKVPAALAPMVAGFASLNDFRPHPMLHKNNPGWNEMRGRFAFPYLGNQLNNLSPADFAVIYNLNPLFNLGSPITGQGQTIVVVEDTDMSADDWNTFRTSFGLNSFAGTLTQIHPAPPAGVKHLKNCKDPGTNLDEVEAALDAEWATAVAPDAAIEVAACDNTRTTFGGLIAAQNLLNSDSPPPIISVSYGDCESDLGKAGNGAFNANWQLAAAVGTSVYVAAGDSGAAGCDGASIIATGGIAASGYASTPFNVAVGGTDFQDAVNNNISTYWSGAGLGTQTVRSYVPETPWNDTCASSLLFTYAALTNGVDFCNGFPGMFSFTNDIAGGGGPSAIYAKPSWQAGVVGIVNDSRRDTPDVSLFAGNGLFTHALLFCMSDLAQEGVPCDYSNPIDANFNSAGGTSFSSPAFAGIQALINQQTGQKWGNPNPVLYAFGANEYGSPAAPNQGNLTACNSNNGNTIGGACVFYDVTLGDIDVPCSKPRKGKARNCFGPPANPVGVLSTSNTTSAPAYPSTGGWDFATGLGTVNIANLVTGWSATAALVPANH